MKIANIAFALAVVTSPLSAATPEGEGSIIEGSSPIEVIGLEGYFSFNIGESITLPAGEYRLKVNAINGFYLKPISIDVNSTVTMVGVTPTGEPLFSVVTVR